MSLDRIRKAMVCRYCRRIDLKNVEHGCAHAACTCEEAIQLSTVLDLYAWLYHLLDNVNYKYFESLSMEERLLYDRISMELERRWLTHKGDRRLQYKTQASWGLLPATDQLFRESIGRAASGTELLCTLFAWLLLLDRELGDLRQSLETRQVDLPIMTAAGPVLFRNVSELAILLEGTDGFQYPTDANSLELRTQISHFYLVRSEYESYTVIHRKFNMRRYSNDDLARLTFCFIPGKFDMAQYSIESDEPALDRQGRIPFRFEGLRDGESYTARVFGLLDAVLREVNPEFILMPELFSPLAMQRAMIERVRNASVERKAEGKELRLQLFGTGSFHAKRGEILGDADCNNPDLLYNYAQAIDGDGKKWADIYKMYQFMLRTPGPTGPRIEVENNAYDQRELVLLETEIGRMVFLICVDFIQEDLLRVLIDREVRWVFVMSMTRNPAGGKFLRQMQTLGERINAVILLCNNLGHSGASGARTVIYMPGFTELLTDTNEQLSASLRELIDKAAVLQKEKTRSAEAP